LSLESGVQISQRDCIVAERSLEEIYESELNDDSEVPRG